MMRTTAPLGMIPTSPSREGDGRSAWAAPGLMQTRLTRNLAWRTSRGIPLRSRHLASLAQSFPNHNRQTASPRSRCLYRSVQYTLGRVWAR